MSDTRSPLRHVSAGGRRAGPAARARQRPDDAQPGPDLQATFAALARRPDPNPDSRPAAALHAAGLTRLVAGVHALPAVPVPARTAAPAPVPAVTRPSPASASPSPAPASPTHRPPPATHRPGPATDRPAAVAHPAPPVGGVRNYPSAVVAAADANRRALTRAALPTREQTRSLLVATARAMGVDPALALAVAYQESGFDQHQVSPANAIGVMQVVPSAGKWASGLVGRQLDLLDTRDNIIAGLTLLQALIDSGTETEAVAGYYQGLSSVRMNGMYDDTRRYLANVQTLRARFASGG